MLRCLAEYEAINGIKFFPALSGNIYNRYKANPELFSLVPQNGSNFSSIKRNLSGFPALNEICQSFPVLNEICQSFPVLNGKGGPKYSHRRTSLDVENRIIDLRKQARLPIAQMLLAFVLNKKFAI